MLLDRYAFGVVLGRVLLGGDDARLVKFGDVPGLPNLDDGQRTLLRALLHPEAARRPTAAQALDHAFFKGRVVLECVVCMDDFTLSEGVQCPPHAGNAQHFTCKPCLERHVTTFAQEDIRFLKTREVRVRCPSHPQECGAGPLSDAIVAAAVTSDCFAAYAACRLRVAEADLVGDMERDKKREIEAELRRLLAMDEDQRRVHAAAQHVRDMLTDGCPRCKQAFIDFNGCRTPHRTIVDLYTLYRHRCLDIRAASR